MANKKYRISEDIFSIENMPCSSPNKTIQNEGYAYYRKTRYFKRVYNDGSAELIRYDFDINKWIVLCFIA